MPNPIVDLVEKELNWFQRVWTEDRDRRVSRRIFPDKNNLYPIPFFGDIRRAEVLTIAMNPAHDEFDHRQWPPHVAPTALNAPALASRLLHYFDLPEPIPHSFFRQFSQMLQMIDCGYRRNAAHIDLSSLPTVKPRQMTDQQRPIFVENFVAFAARLNEVLRLATSKKLLLVADFKVNDGHGGQTSVWQLLGKHCPLVKLQANEGGELLPILRAENIGALTSAILRNRHEIREHLKSSPPLAHPSHE